MYKLFANIDTLFFIDLSAGSKLLTLNKYWVLIEYTQLMNVLFYPSKFYYLSNISNPFTFLY